MINAHQEGNTVWLVTGASNGVGAAFLPLLLSRPATTVVALHRATSAVADIDVHSTSAIYTHSYDAVNTEAEISKLAEAIRTARGINRIHIVLASAGMVDGMKPVLSTGWEEVQKHMDVNFGGPLKLVQGLKGLLGLDASTDTPNTSGTKFIFISSSVGSLTQTELVPGCLAYGSSKAAANYMITRLHVELEAHNFITAAIHPGWVRTRMGLHAADEWGVSRDFVPLTSEESAAAILKIVDTCSRETVGGRFLSYDGTELPW
ncbi:hypothetical protein LTR84_003346 [Exophiala bonariae]|uniref:Uncharacterized protein n=1 Tax=Exophiala bonariae TaxID=1690606 RepID=A0AAV9NBB4_9EURO|nr:hypothetical protein LTR84_003346 [Exophiala bonariae]